MRNLIILFIVCLFVLMTACSSMESDAREAAELNIRSLNHLSQGNLQLSEETYKESQRIMEKYRNSGRFTEFLSIYNQAFENRSIKEKK